MGVQCSAAHAVRKNLTDDAQRTGQGVGGNRYTNAYLVLAAVAGPWYPVPENCNRVQFVVLYQLVVVEVRLSPIQMAQRMGRVGEGGAESEIREQYVTCSAHMTR